MEQKRIIAIHLPQFHPFKENDEWWGKGFTEWTNVAKARPRFRGHYQPHIPADLGFYDLRLEESRIAQANLAKEYGIYGFCYYHYWFNGHQLMERPLEEILSTLFQYVDTAMVGHLGEAATASVSVTTTITWLVNSIPHAISIAILAMVAKAFGAKDENRIRKISMQALMLAVVCGIITGAISLICSPYIPVWMGADKSIRHDASEYFFIISSYKMNNTQCSRHSIFFLEKYLRV